VVFLRRSLALVVGIALFVGALGACVTAKPPALTAQVQQYREDEVAGRLQIGLTNLTASTVQVKSVQLKWPGLETQPATVIDYALSPGVRADLATPLGSARCSGPAPAATSARVTVVLSGSNRVEDLPVVQSDDVLRRVYATACEQEYLAERLSVSFGDTWTPVNMSDGPALIGRLHLERKSFDGPISVVDLRGTVVLQLLPVRATTPLGLMAATQSSTDVPVYMQPARCDLHALGEVKKPFSFVAGVRLGTGARLPARVSPDAATKARLWRLIKLGCGVP
jgi:hypothetical protein